MGDGINNLWTIVWTSFAVLVIVGFFGWAIWRALQKSDEPGSLIVRLIITAVLLLITVFWLFPRIARFDIGSAALIPHLAAVAVILAIIWTPSWISMLIKPLTGAIDGGDADGEITPQYSRAEARRSRGQYPEAVVELRSELEKFPDDLRLQLMLAEILAEHLEDLQGAESIIFRIAQQPHSPANIASAFNQLADWYLKLRKDADAARQALEQVIAAFPNTQFSQNAAQRIARLATPEHLLGRDQVAKIKMREYERDLGLKRSVASVSQDNDQEQHRAREILDHLEQHPLDNDAREELAKLYAEQYNRLQLAADQLEQMIARPNQKARDIIRWLNLLADYHIKVGNDVAGAENALQRVIRLFPDSAGAEQARTRLATLKLELNRNKKSQAIKLGSYEKDIGLKMNHRPTGPPRVE